MRQAINPKIHSVVITCSWRKPVNILLNVNTFFSVVFALKVKSCVTAFHVTCGFKHGLEMRTVLDDNATDGVRHIVSTLAFNIVLTRWFVNSLLYWSYVELLYKAQPQDQVTQQEI